MTDAAFYRDCSDVDALSQGDILDNVHCVDSQTGPDGDARRVLVLTHGCEIDKKNAQTFYGATVVALNADDPQLGNIRSGRVANVIYLPAHDSLGGDAYVDLRAIFRIKFASIGATEFKTNERGESTRQLGDRTIRLLALSEFGLTAMRGRLIQYFFRSDLEPRAGAAPIQ